LIGKCFFCSEYAKLAVDAFDEQEKLFCGNPGGPRWSKNYNGHLNWCFGQGEQHVVLSETSARSMLVGKCEMCGRYAKDAMRAREEAIANKCDISGARWSGHSGGHKSWCMEKGQLIVGRTASEWGDNAWKIEKVARDAELNECKQCRAYAKEAAAQGKKARICYGLTGPLWSTSETRHFDNCIAMDDGSRDAETKQQADARAKGLGECKVGVTTRPLDPAMATRSGAGAGKSGSSTLKESSPVRTGRKKESTNDTRTGSAVSNSDAALPRNRPKPLSRGLLESDPGLGPGGPSATGTPSGAPAGGSPAGGGLRLR
jgi:hypothetical protein